MGTLEDRNTRLDNLKTAVGNFVTARKAQLQRQIDINERILQGRGGSEGLAQSTVQEANNLVVDEINDFLTG